MTADWDADSAAHGYEIETTYINVKSGGEYRYNDLHILSAPGTENLLAGDGAAAALTTGERNVAPRGGDQCPSRRQSAHR